MRCSIDRCFVWLALSATVLAEDPSPWTRHEIGGGEVREIQVEGFIEGLVWVSATEMFGINGEGQVFQTRDGQSWSVAAGRVDTKALGGHQFAGRRGTLVAWGSMGLARSTDDGRTWEYGKHPRSRASALPSVAASTVT